MRWYAIDTIASKGNLRVRSIDWLAQLANPETIVLRYFWNQNDLYVRVCLTRRHKTEARGYLCTCVNRLANMRLVHPCLANYGKKH